MNQLFLRLNKCDGLNYFKEDVAITRTIRFSVRIFRLVQQTNSYVNERNADESKDFFLIMKSFFRGV
jgi:hypothetical protein